MAIRHEITLSTTDPNNEIGLVKIRQADEETQTLVTQITENATPRSYEGLQVFFCAKLGQSLGLGIIEQKLNDSEMTAPKNGKLEYTMRAEDWQQIGRQVGYFSFRKMTDDHTYVEQFTTRDFYFTVTKNVFSEGLKEVKKDGSTYVWTIEDLLRLFNEYIASGKTNWEEFVEQNREVLESVDPGGTILSELIRSRKPEESSTPFRDLPERLDHQIGKNSDFRGFEPDQSFMRKIYNENSERGLNARWFNVTCDGITDDSAALQALVDNAGEGTPIIFPANSKIVISQPITITKSNLYFNFQGSTLLYNGTTDLGDSNGIYRSFGALNFKGSIISDSKLEVTSVKKFEGIVDKKHYDYADNFNGMKTPFTKLTRLTISSDPSAFYTYGDYVEVLARNYTESNWDKRFGDNPATIKIISKVIFVDKKYVYVDFANDFKFDDKLAFGTIRKIKPIKNITVENLNFVDINDTPIPETITSKDRNSWVGGIKAEYAVDLIINNFKARKFRFPALSMNFVYGLTINSFRATDSRLTTAGCGYGAQIMNSLTGVINNVRGNFIRHLVDFSGSGDFLVQKCKMPNDWRAAFDCHGQGEFDITYEDCIGRITIGNGINEFPEMADNIKIIRHSGSVFADWCKSLLIRDSELFFDAKNVIKCPRIAIKNSRLLFKKTDINFIDFPRGGTYLESSFIIDQCSIDIFDETNLQGVTVADRVFEMDYYDSVKVNILKVNNKTGKNMKMYFVKCKEAIVSESYIENLGINFSDEINTDTYIPLYKNRYHRSLKILNSSISTNLSSGSENCLIKINSESIVGNINLLSIANTFKSSPGSNSWLRSTMSKATLQLIFNNNITIGTLDGWSHSGSMSPTVFSNSGNINNSTGNGSIIK